MSDRDGFVDGGWKAIEALRQLSITNDHAHLIGVELAKPPRIDLARVFEAVRAAAMGCKAEQLGLATIPLEMLIQAYAQMVDMERKLDPALWNSNEVEAWYRSVGYANLGEQFKRLRAARG